MDATQEELFPDIESSEAPQDVEPDIEEVEVDPVQEKIKELEAKLEKKDEEASRLNEQLLATVSRQTQQPVQQTQEVEQDEKLPDLLEDPEGYAATLQRNLERKMQREISTKQAQTDQNARYDRLTSRFQVKEPELAKENWDVVEFIVTKKVREAAANGIGVDALVFANQDKFIDEVARDVKAMVGGKPDDEDNTATQDLPSAGGITTRTKKKQTEKKPKSFMESFKEVRRLTPGFYNPATMQK